MSKRRNTQKKPPSITGDVNIYSYADNTIVSNRLKKSDTSINGVIKNAPPSETLDDSDLIESLKLSLTITPTETAPEEVNFIEYPNFIWTILSSYIRAEDVGRFAGICKATNDVVHHSKFWYDLYKDYYKHLHNLPEELQPQSIVRKFGLRTNVIKSLFYFYPPLISQLPSKQKVKTLPHNIKFPMQIVSTWWDSLNNKTFRFVFKLRDLKHKPCVEITKDNYLDLMDDVFWNREENCKALIVETKMFIPLPDLVALRLTALRLPFMGSMGHDLEMDFQATNAVKKKRFTFVLKQVTNIVLRDWWDPDYPQRRNMINSTENCIFNC